MTEKNFPNGIYFNLPKEKAPDFVKGNVSIKKAEFIAWLEQQPMNNNGYINDLDLKVSKAGKGYLEENTWKPEKQEDKPNPMEVQESPKIDYPEEEINPDDIPFN